MGMVKRINLVLKGGVASGLIYAALLPRLAQNFALSGLAGASAGAIAASLGAAAEYARGRGDAAGFARLETACAALPAQLPRLLHAKGAAGAVLRALLHLAPGSGRPRWGQALWAMGFPLSVALLIGVCGAAKYAQWSQGGGHAAAHVVATGLVFLVFVLLTVMVYAFGLARLVCRRHFGLCTGLGSGDQPGVTDWLHQALQTISGADAPLTFGDLCAQHIRLHIVTTDLSRVRVHMLPELDTPLWFDPKEWAGLFPSEVLGALQPQRPALRWPLPPPEALPVLVAVRMSLACPGLMSQIPVYAQAEGGVRLYLSDGGVANNFPFDVFDADDAPTWGIDFDSLRDGDDEARRVGLLSEAQEGNRIAADPMPNLLAYVWNLLASMREADIRRRLLTATRASRIIRIRLKRNEGGMNLHMSAEQTAVLAACGETAAQLITETERPL